MSDEVRETAAVYQVDEPVDPCVTPPSISADLLPLIRLLEYADGFTLAFLVHNVPVEAERLVDQLLAELASRGRPGRVVRLKGQSVDLLSEIERVGQEPNRPLFVLGFERSIPSDQEFPPALTQLNMARENFRDLPFPVVLVLPDYALTKLAREAQDFWAWRSGVFEVPSESPDLVERETLDELIDSSFKMSRPSALRHARVLESLLAKHQDRGAKKEQLDLHRRLGMLLHQLEKDEEAVGHLERGIQLAQEFEDREVLAELLVWLAKALAGNGDSVEALNASKEAVHLWQELAAEDPRRHLPHLADSLDGFASRLAGVGQRDQAVDASQEAVGLLRQLAEEDPSRYRIELARGLNNLSNFLSLLGHEEESLQAGSESVTILRDLAEESPEEHSTDYAAGLHNLAAAQRDLGRLEQALQAGQGAVEIYRGLATEEPERYGADLARSLNDLAASLSSVGAHEAALAALQEAVESSRESARDGSMPAKAGLASSLTNLSNVLAAAGDSEAAYSVILEAIEMRRELTALDPNRSPLELAGALWNLADLQRNFGREAEASAILLEAIELVEPLAQRYPESLEHAWWQRIKQTLMEMSAAD